MVLHLLFIISHKQNLGPGFITHKMPIIPMSSINKSCVCDDVSEKLYVDKAGIVRVTTVYAPRIY